MVRYLKILIFDSTDDILNIVFKKLSDWKLTVSFRQVKSYNELVESIQNSDWDFVICEIISNTDFIKLLKIVRFVYKYIPVIVLSNIPNEEFAFRIIKAGATDYIPRNEIYRLRQIFLKTLSKDKFENDIFSKTITDRNADKKELYQSLINNMTEAFLYAKVVCNTSGIPVDYIILEVNNSFEEMTGFKRNDILGQQASKINPDILSSNPNLIEICGHTALNGDRKRFELYMDNGKKIYMVSVYCPKPGYFVNVFSDCTEQKKSETEMQKMFTVIEQSPAIIIITDTRGNVEYVNPSFITLTGFSNQETIGKNFSLVGLGKMPASRMREIWQKLRNGEVWIGEFFNKTKSGGLFWVSASISPLYNKDGTLINYISIQEDISEKKMMYQKLIEKNRKLKRAMKELAAMQEQLIIQEEFAGIKLLASGVAHEINNPLGFIISNIDILNKYFEDIQKLIREYRNWINNIDNNKYICGHEKIMQAEKDINLEYLLEDIPMIFDECNNGLWRISTIVNGLDSNTIYEQQDIYSDFDINKGVENALIIINNQVKQNAEIRKELVRLPNINVVAEKIERVLLNLIMNAIQAVSMKNSTERGLIIIRTYSDKKYICCEIEDNGVGISKENMNKIFHPFFTTKSNAKGTGLGLSISYDIIVNLHGGQLTVKSEHGKGTLAQIKLPM